MISWAKSCSGRAQQTPGAPAVSCGDLTLTLGQLEALGVKLGDLVTIGLPMVSTSSRHAGAFGSSVRNPNSILPTPDS